MSRLSLDRVEWKEFVLGSLFDIQIGKTIDGNKIQGNLGKKPYITRKVTDNGLDNFIDNYPNEFLYSDVPVITIGNETAKPFVQIAPFYTGTKVNILKPKERLEKEKLLFICTALEKVCDRYSYSFTANSTRLKKQIILLPIDVNGNPNWQFMEDFIKQEQREQVQKLINYYEQKLLKYNVIHRLPCIDWKEFWLEDIVEIKSGVRLTKADQVAGNRPFIGSTSNNNGVTGFVENTNGSLDANVLGVNYNGSVVDNFYHPYECIFSDDVKRMHIKEKSARNKYCYLFLKRAILQQKTKYAYGYKFNATRMKRQKIMLPVDENRNPHWEYMHISMQKLEFEKISTVLEYLRCISSAPN